MILTAMSLPQEIFLAVIEQVEDAGTLQSCALVSRSCVTPSQRQIFCQVTVSLLSTSPASTTRFNRVLDESPRLATYVRGLQVIQEGAEDTADEQKVLSTVLPRLTHLDSLSLNGKINLYPFLFDSALWEALSEVFQSSNTRCIELSGWHFGDLGYFSRFMRLLNLSSLSLLKLDVLFLSLNNVLTSGTRTATFIGTLDTNSYGNGIVTWLQANAVIVKHLTIGNHCSVEPLLEHLSPGLEGLTLHQGTPFVDLTNAARLSKLCLFLEEPMLKLILNTLRTIPAASNDVKFIEFRGVNLSTLSTSAQWFQTLDILLTSEHFPSLTTVLLSFSTRSSNQPGESVDEYTALKLSMPSSLKKDIIRLHFDSPGNRIRVPAAE
ncbi:hypothetical protein ONZ45_g14937 [Pleurotus djamor]|nr:hypothetical protein ONZ45_g14937 [Pleurotus djamor]